MSERISLSIKDAVVICLNDDGCHVGTVRRIEIGSKLIELVAVGRDEKGMLIWTERTPILVEDRPSFQLPDGPPLSGICPACGSDLDALRKRGRDRPRLLRAGRHRQHGGVVVSDDIEIDATGRIAVTEMNFRATLAKLAEVNRVPVIEVVNSCLRIADNAAAYDMLERYRDELLVEQKAQDDRDAKLREVQEAALAGCPILYGRVRIGTPIAVHSYFGQPLVGKCPTCGADFDGEAGHACVKEPA